jgi:hypothetical protein
MRTTLNIDTDLLLAAKKIARREDKTIGHVLSELARSGLAKSTTISTHQPKVICGFQPFPKAGRMVSNELINKLRESGEY